MAELSGDQFEVSIDTASQLITAPGSGGGCLRLAVSANYTDSGERYTLYA